MELTSAVAPPQISKCRKFFVLQLLEMCIIIDSSLSFLVICVVLHRTMWCPSTYWYGAL